VEDIDNGSHKRAMASPGADYFRAAAPRRWPGPALARSPAVLGFVCLGCVLILLPGTVKVPPHVLTDPAVGKQIPRMDGVIQQCLMLGMSNHWRCEEDHFVS